MIANPYYSQENHGPFELADIGNFELEDGGTIPNCQLAYATFGRLNAAKDNAILVTTWYTGTSKIMEQVYIGSGRALDPERYFIIVINQIGSGLSTSPHNAPDPISMSKFPHVRIGDDVRAQHQLLTETFGGKVRFHKSSREFIDGPEAQRFILLLLVPLGAPAHHHPKVSLAFQAGGDVGAGGVQRSDPVGSRLEGRQVPPPTS